MKMKVCSMFTVNGLALGMGAFGLVLLAASHCIADVCTEAQTAVEYDSTDGDEPNETADWSFTCNGVTGVDFATITDGILIINDTSTSTKAKYCAQDLFDDSCDPRQDAVYEFSCKALGVATNSDAWTNHGAQFVFSCGFSTGTDDTKDFDIRLAVTLDQGIGFFEVDGNGNASWLSVGGIEQHIDMSQVDNDEDEEWTQAHVFRVEKNGSFVKLFIDNNDTPALNFRLTYLADNYLEDEIIMLGTSNPGRSNFELMHFRYRIGATNFNTISPNGCAGDFDDDDDVDTEDLLLLFAAWGPCTSCDEDLNSDDVVNTEDLLILFSNWGDCP